MNKRCKTKKKQEQLKNTKVRTQTANNLRALIVNSKKKISLTRKLKELKIKNKSCKKLQKQGKNKERKMNETNKTTQRISSKNPWRNNGKKSLSRSLFKIVTKKMQKTNEKDKNDFKIT